MLIFKSSYPTHNHYHNFCKTNQMNAYVGFSKTKQWGTYETFANLHYFPTTFHFFLVYIFIFDGEMTGDRGKHDQETVTWSNGEKYEVKFSDGRMYNQIV